MLDAGLLADLRALVGENGLVTGAAVRERAIDINGNPPRASALVRPRTTDEVSGILKLCCARGQPEIGRAHV